MNKKFFSKLVISLSAIVLCFNILGFTTKNASAASSSQVLSFENLVLQDNISIQALPPRQSPKDPFWKWFTLVMAGFVGLSLAQTITQNAINNGIDAACNKWKNTWGVKQACKIVKS